MIQIIVKLFCIFNSNYQNLMILNIFFYSYIYKFNFYFILTFVLNLFFLIFILNFVMIVLKFN